MDLREFVLFIKLFIVTKMEVSKNFSNVLRDIKYDIVHNVLPITQLFHGWKNIFGQINGDVFYKGEL